MKQIKSLKELKKLSQKHHDFFISLGGCLRSSKMIDYDHDTKKFFVEHFVDGTEEYYTDKELADGTNIVSAIEQGKLYME